MGVVFAELKSLEDQERRLRVLDMNRELDARMKELAEILSPEQLKRLQQILNQIRAQSAKSSAGLLSQSAISALELSQSQQEAIKTKAPVVERKLSEKQKELHDEYVKYRDAALRELFDILTEDQKRKYVEMFGKPFDLDATR